jgi:flagellar basal body-associated protein FliL
MEARMGKSKKGAAPDAAGGEGEPKKSKKKLIIGVVAAAGIGAGGYVYGAGSSSSAAAAVTTTTTIAPALKLGPIVDLPAINLNLMDGHFLRVAVSLAMAPEMTAEEVKTFNGAVAKDLVVETLSGRTVKDLSTPEGRRSAKEELTSAIDKAYGEMIEEVLFTDFVMQ